MSPRMASYYSVENNDPLPSNENPDLPPRWLTVWKVQLVCAVATIDNNLTVCSCRRSCLRKLKSSKHVITHHSNHTHQATAADVRPRTLDDGVIGHRFHAPSVVIKRQVPHPRVQVLDESGLVDGDRMIQPRPGLRFARSPMLLGDEPAAVQQLHKIILQNNTQNRFRQMQMSVILMSAQLNQAVKRQEGSKTLYFSPLDVLYAASPTVWEELFKVVMQDRTWTGLCTQQIFKYNKCWFFSDSYLELIDVVWRVVCTLMELIWLWGKCWKIFQKYIVNSDRSALKETRFGNGFIIIC